MTHNTNTVLKDFCNLHFLKMALFFRDLFCFASHFCQRDRYDWLQILHRSGHTFDSASLRSRTTHNVAMNQQSRQSRRHCWSPFHCWWFGDGLSLLTSMVTTSFPCCPSSSLTLATLSLSGLTAGDCYCQMVNLLFLLVVSSFSMQYDFEHSK